MVAEIMPWKTNCSKEEASNKICIVGGSSKAERVWYAGYAARQCGADCVIVVTTPSAAIPMKIHSSALTVVAYLPEKNDTLSLEQANKLWSIVEDCHAFCIGPGLGKDRATRSAVYRLFEKIKLYHIPIVLNSDALWILHKDDDLGFGNFLNVPSVVILDETEFVCLWGAVCNSDIMSVRSSASPAAPIADDHGWTECCNCSNWSL